MKLKKYEYYHGFKPMFQNFKNGIKISKEITENSVKCKCGHTITMSAKTDKIICSWCSRTVINTTKNHFKYVIRKKIKDEEKR